MRIRPRLFLTFLALCMIPLVLLGLVNYWNAVHNAEAALERDQKTGLDHFQRVVDQLLTRDQNALANLSRSKPLRQYLVSRNEVPVNSPARFIWSPADGALSAEGKASSPIPVELTVRVASVLNRQSHFTSISFFDRNRGGFCVAELPNNDADEAIVFHVQDSLSAQPQPDDRLWNTHSNGLSSSVSTGSFGARVAYSVPIFPEGQNTGTPQGATMGDLNLDAILSEAAQRNKSFFDRDSSESVQSLLVVVDGNGRFLYHSNEGLRHQLASERMLEFVPLAKQMFASESGHHSYISAGARYSVTYQRLPALNLSVAAASNRDQWLAGAHRTGRIGLVVLVLLGLAAAWFLTHYFQRRALGLERVTQGVEAIAKGELDHRIELRSSDDLRPLADNVGLMTKQLREQIAREAETRQFQSFVRLSAVLTHDLKNAIEALSLIVSNMERHFDNQEFRADAMKSLNLATQNLRALVTRLSTPVNTLSGEHKIPRPVDLIPTLKRVISLTAEPARGRHEIRIDLPESLFVLVDPERIKKVVENLIINGLEAMTRQSGTLTVAAGQLENGKAFFSVSDTGIGMSSRFIAERLFHPFATTKQRGVGLGLYTCREVVRANAGSIEVDSIQGAGTTFRVVLPSAAFYRREDKESQQSHR